jgi:hypothetical protein
LPAPIKRVLDQYVADFTWHLIALILSIY